METCDKIVASVGFLIFVALIFAVGVLTGSFLCDNFNHKYMEETGKCPCELRETKIVTKNKE